MPVHVGQLPQAHYATQLKPRPAGGAFCRQAGKTGHRQFPISRADFGLPFFIFTPDIQLCRQKTREFCADLPINKDGAAGTISVWGIILLDPAWRNKGNV
jgi:hypothetical protein